jgi:hypothetical protein
VAKFSLRRHDVQAQVSMVLSIAAVPFLLATAFLVLRNLVLSEKIIPYSSKSLLMPAIYLAAALAGSLATAGFGLGVNSVGQRRNDKPILSWIGFFVGATVMSLVLVLLLLFKMWGEAIN